MQTSQLEELLDLPQLVVALDLGVMVESLAQRSLTYSEDRSNLPLRAAQSSHSSDLLWFCYDFQWSSTRLSLAQAPVERPPLALALSQLLLRHARTIPHQIVWSQPRLVAC